MRLYSQPLSLSGSHFFPYFSLSFFFLPLPFLLYPLARPDYDRASILFWVLDPAFLFLEISRDNERIPVFLSLPIAYDSLQTRS